MQPLAQCHYHRSPNIKITDHRDIVSRLSTREHSWLTEKSDAAGLKHFALHMGAIILCTLSINLAGPLWLLPLMLIQGVLITFLFTTLHETVHRTPFKTRSINIRVGQICGFLVFLGPEWFRYFHFEHHRHTNIPGKDPELTSPKPDTLTSYLAHLSGVPETLGRFRTLFRNALCENSDAYVPEAGKLKVKREARIQVALYGALLVISVVLMSPLLLILWLIPFLISAPFLRAYLLAEHAHCPHVYSMLDNTRTTFTNRWVKFLAWNMPYHAEHHAFPAVPFHRLPDFNQYIREHVSNIEHGYLRFNKNYVEQIHTHYPPKYSNDD